MKLLNLIFVPLVGARVVQTQQQIPITSDSRHDGVDVEQANQLESTEEDAPTVGVHFTTSYAIATVRHQNGTMTDLSKVAGDADYIELMSRWTSAPDSESDNCRNRLTGMATAELQVRRIECRKRMRNQAAHRLMGEPITRDSGILANFVTRVRESIEQELGQSITTIAPAFPRLSADTRRELRDAFNHAGLDSTLRHSELPVYEEANAAYAALGHGLCPLSVDYNTCRMEPRFQQSQSVLFLSFDNSSFSVGVTSLKTAFRPRSTFSYGTDTKLGFWNLPVFEVPRAKFWAQIQDMVTAVIRPLGRPPNSIVLLGGHGADDEFKEVVKAAVWEEFEFDAEMMMEANRKEDVEYLAARGAAELGVRTELWTRQNEALRFSEETRQS